jgi:hypothetical protein
MSRPVSLYSSRNGQGLHLICKLRLSEEAALDQLVKLLLFRVSVSGTAHRNKNND